MSLSNFLKRNKAFSILLFILLVTTLIDLFTAFGTPAFEHGEMNPIYLLTGSKAVVLILVMAIQGFVCWLTYKANRPLLKSFLVCVLVVWSVAHLLGAYTNIVADNQYSADPVAYEEAAAELGTQGKKSLYAYFAVLFILAPLFFAWTCCVFTLYICRFNPHFYEDREPILRKQAKKAKKTMTHLINELDETFRSKEQ